MATVALGFGALLLMAGCGRGADPDEGQLAGTLQSQAPAVTTTDAGPDSTIPAGTATGLPTVQAPEPTRVRVPAIGVDATMIPLGLRDDGSIEVPSDFDQAGWWVDGPEPGETGPAVILGHVDSRQGPAVFFDLRALAPGDAIHVDRADGTTVTYTVERTEQHPKDAFPTQAVYGSTDQAVLRLVTCGGEFDRDERSYRDNVIVLATLSA